MAPRPSRSAAAFTLRTAQSGGVPASTRSVTLAAVSVYEPAYTDWTNTSALAMVEVVDHAFEHLRQGRIDARHEGEEEGNLGHIVVSCTGGRGAGRG